MLKIFQFRQTNLRVIRLAPAQIQTGTYQFPSIYNTSKMSNFFQSSFQIEECHLEGCSIDISSSHHSLYSIGNDDVLCQYNPNHPPIISIISNPNALQLSKIAHHSQTTTFAVATQTGVVLGLEKDSNAFTVNSSKTIYKSLTESAENKVRSLTFTQNGQFLIIATNEPYCIVYEWKTKKFFKHKLDSDTQIASITVDHRNQYFCLIDFDGKATVYQIDKDQDSQKMDIENCSDSEDPFAQLNTQNKPKSIKNLCSYKITKTNSPIFKKNNSILACFNYAIGLMTQTLYLPGQTVLQKLQLSLPPAMFTLQYQLCNNISHLTEIQQVLWLKHHNCGLIFTGTQIEASIWHQTKTQKLMNFNLDTAFGPGKLIKNVCLRKFTDNNNWGFAMIFKSRNQQDTVPSKVYDFKAFSELEDQLVKRQTAQLNLENDSQVQMQPLEESKKKANKKKRKKPEQDNIASKLLRSNFELPLSTAYDRRPGDNARFLFYNNVGCVIERFQSDNIQSTIELQLHDRSKISRMKIPPEMIVQYFALCSDTVVFASSHKIDVQSEKHLREGFQWEYEWEQIEGVAIGGDWICAVNKDQIKVWDWVGNQLHSVSFDRKFMCMAAYQDLLVIVFHSSIPMWGASFYKMVVFELTSKTMKCIRQVSMPTKPTISLKWFGFSEEGMLCCKDEGQNIRVYLFERDEWIPVNSYDPLLTRFFIQHIQNYELFGFKLDQKFPSDPRVLPRSLPKKELFDLADSKQDFLTKEQNEYIKKHKLSLMWLEHEKFRNARWYKHKYSRNKDNRWYSRTQTIKSEQEIKANQAQMDLRLLDYFKKYLKLNKEARKDDKTVWDKVLLLCSSLAFYNETRNKLSEVLEESVSVQRSVREVRASVCPQYSREMRQMKRQSITQLERLEEMMGLSWVRFQQRKQHMQIEI